MPINGKDLLDENIFAGFMKALLSGSTHCCTCGNLIDNGDPGEVHMVIISPAKDPDTDKKPAA